MKIYLKNILLSCSYWPQNQCELFIAAVESLQGFIASVFPRILTSFYGRIHLYVLCICRNLTVDEPFIINCFILN